MDENDVDALCDKGEAHILNEMYDEGKLLSSVMHKTVNAEPSKRYSKYFPSNNVLSFAIRFKQC